MKKLANLFVTFSFAFLAVFGFSAVAQTSFVEQNVVEAKATSLISSDREVKSTDADNGEAGKITSTIYKAANIFAGFVLGISIITIIVGGLKYILANGDQRAAESGKMILIYSGIGIVIALSAFVIARLFANLNFTNN